MDHTGDDFKHCKGLLVQIWTEKDADIFLSRRKQGFDSPRGRQSLVSEFPERSN